MGFWIALGIFFIIIVAIDSYAGYERGKLYQMILDLQERIEKLERKR